MRVASVRTEDHKSTCPYCVVGWAIVQIKRSSDGSSINFQLDGHPKCCKCNRFFRVKRQLRLYGARLEEMSVPMVGANGGR